MFAGNFSFTHHSKFLFETVQWRVDFYRTESIVE